LPTLTEPANTPLPSAVKLLTAKLALLVGNTVIGKLSVLLDSSTEIFPIFSDALPTKRLAILLPVVPIDMFAIGTRFAPILIILVPLWTFRKCVY